MSAAAERAAVRGAMLAAALTALPAASQAVTFTDVTAAAGVSYVQHVPCAVDRAG